jgi:phospholipid/cholesterol/gamma-HCH transport system substrate-binding protein
MSKPASPKLIGAFVLGAIALIVGGVLVLGGGKFFQHHTPIVMFFEGSVAGLNVGSPVNFRGVKVGQVTNVFIRYEPDERMPVQIPVFAEFSSENVQIVGPDEENKETQRATDNRLRALVDQGLRAQLALPSLVTGQATISLDFFPGSQADFSNIYPKRVEIPTVPSTLQEVQATLQQLYGKLSQLPFDQLLSDAQDVLKGANRLINDPAVAQAVANASQAMGDVQKLSRTLDARVGPLLDSLQATSQQTNRTLIDAQQLINNLQTQADQLSSQTDKTLQATQQALTQLDRAMNSANSLIEPGSRLNYELVNALKESSAAARSLRDLADQLQRSPNSLLFGRPAKGGN